MRNFLYLILLGGLSSCFLFKGYRKGVFTYTASGQPQTVLLLVPKGFVKQEVRDTAGIHLHTFQYAGGTLLYAAYLTDTTYELQPYDKTLHQPKAFGTTGLVYKGQNANNLFYREIRQGNLRFGYSGVPEFSEVFFDSATNYAAMKRR